MRRPGASRLRLLGRRQRVRRSVRQRSRTVRRVSFRHGETDARAHARAGEGRGRRDAGRGRERGRRSRGRSKRGGRALAGAAARIFLRRRPLHRLRRVRGRLQAVERHPRRLVRPLSPRRDDSRRSHGGSRHPPGCRCIRSGAEGAGRPSGRCLRSDACAACRFGACCRRLGFGRACRSPIFSERVPALSSRALRGNMPDAGSVARCGFRREREGTSMCYPCVNCGKCGSKLPEAKIRCPKCKTVLDESHPVCETCGWRLPLPPGAKASPRGAREAR